MRKRTRNADRGDTRQGIVDAATELFMDNESGSQPSVRDIAARAGVAPGMVTHHFSSYSGLMAELNARLYGEQAQENTIANFKAGKNSTPHETAKAYFRALATLDLGDDYKRLRRATGRASWDWHAQGESAQVENHMKLLKPLRDALGPENSHRHDDVLKALWAIYQHALRLALINALLPPTADKSLVKVVEAVVAEISPGFALVLR